MRIQFTGNAPAFRSDSFSYLTADVYYPQGNSTWNEDVFQAYGGELTWIPYDSETEEPDISEPTEPDPTDPTEPEPDPNTGVCGESITWTLDPESGKLTLRGSGDMTDYASYEDVPWYRGTPGVVRTVDVGDNITSIGDYAFAYCGGITDVRLPEGLERIGANAFFDCVELENIQIPETVTEIGTHTFYKCNEIHDVKLPDGITEIADYAFAYCRRFTVNIPSRVTRIGAGAFYRCGGDTVTVPATVKFVGEYAFATCEFDRLVFLGDAPEIQDNAFYGAELNCFYPRGNATWTEEVRQGYGTSHITWTACDPDDLDIPDYQPDPEPPGQFTDVKESSYCYEPVLWAVENGITTGMSATKFMPDNPCTRAQVVTFLWRAAGEPLPVSGKNPFTDVKSSAYYYNAVLWAVEQGITTGMSATSFGPDRPCTRGQVVTFLHRAAGETEPESAGNPFTDVKESGFYYKAVLWAVENGITTGMSATRFEPGRTCTRGQVVTFLYRAN